MRFESGSTKRAVSHEIRVYREIRELIERGEKTWEVRVAFPIFTKIKVGDTLNFGSGLEKKVAEIRRFKTAEACISDVGVRQDTSWTR